MLIVGLTGGIGSGKSLVTEYFRQAGAGIIDTDEIARSLLQPDSAMYDLVVAHIGQPILNESGQLDRRLLRQYIFENPAEKLWLENRMHPVIRGRVKNALSTTPGPYLIVVIPLLIEVGRDNYPFLNRVCVVKADRSLQLSRTQQRDHLSPALTEKIILAQATDAQRLAIADDVIENTGSLEDVRAQVLALHKHYLALA